MVQEKKAVLQQIIPMFSIVTYDEENACACSQRPQFLSGLVSPSSKSNTHLILLSRQKAHKKRDLILKYLKAPPPHDQVKPSQRF